MPTHNILKIDEATSRRKIVEFLQAAANSDKSGGTLHLRAVEKTYRNKDGTSCTVTKLFVRSGKESLFKWFKNMVNSKSQYSLAAKVLRTRLDGAVDKNDTLQGTSSTLGKSAAALIMASLAPMYREKGIPLCTVSAAFPNQLPGTGTSIN
jgi:hypothetical protein